MKKLIAMVLSIVLLACFAETAFAESATYDIDYGTAQTLFPREECAQALQRAGKELIDNSDLGDDFHIDGFAVCGDKIYGLAGYTGRIYSYDTASGEYEFLTDVPAEPRYKDSEAAQKALRSAVLQIIGSVDSDVLYGYNPSSGLFGTIDQDGIHWNDTKLDNSLSVKYRNGAGEPRDLMVPFVEGDKLYAWYGPLWDDDPDAFPVYKGQIWEYDIKTGACTVTVIERMYTFTPYKSGQALLLRRAESGQMYLSLYDLQARKILQEEFAVLPAHSDEGGCESVERVIAGIAYHEASDSIVYMGAQGPCQSIAGGEFRQLQVDGISFLLEWLIMHQEWIMPNGAYLHETGGSVYMIQ